MPELKTVLHPVSDLAAAKRLYGALLGSDPVADSEYYVGYQAGDVQVGLVPGGGPQQLTGTTAYWHVDDMTASLEALTSAGAEVTQQPHGVGGGRTVAQLKDPDGNVWGLIQDA